MAGTHGGKREGSGRIRHAEKYAKELEGASDLIAGSLLTATEKLVAVAEGDGWEEEWVPTELLTKKDVIRNPDGTPWLDRKGKPVVVDVPAFPNAKPGEEIRVKRKPWKPDVKGVAEMRDRLDGKARQAVELSNEGGKPLLVQFYMPTNGRDTQDVPPPAGPAGGVAQ